MAQQTAVDWLVENLHLHNDVYFVTKNKRDIIEQAKQMEKEQIKDAWHDGNFLGRNGNLFVNYTDSEGYYKKQFGDK